MLAQNVAEAIRQAISDGQFLPGQRLNEVEVAAQFEVSRNTLREAFAMLVAERLAVRIPNRGVFISTPDEEFVTDLYQARAILEPGCARWGDSLDTAAILESTSRACEITASVPEAKRDDETNQRISTLNQAFHRNIVAAAGSTTLSAEMNNLLARMRLTFLLVLPKYPNIHADHVESNAEIARLLAEGSKEEAATRLHASLHRTCEMILETLRAP